MKPKSDNTSKPVKLANTDLEDVSAGDQPNSFFDVFYDAGEDRYSKNTIATSTTVAVKPGTSD